MAFVRASITVGRCQERGFRGTSYRTKRTDMADPNAKFRDVHRNVRDTADRVLKSLSGQRRKRKGSKGGRQSSRVNKNLKNIKQTSYRNAFIRVVDMAAEALSVNSEFHIFAQKPVQTSVQETIETIFRPIALVDKSDLEFVIPSEYIYIDMNIKL